MAINVFPAASSGGGTKNYSQTFNSSTTWTAPTGVTLVSVIAAAGGGGGGGGAQTSTSAGHYSMGGGGGGGQVIRQSLPVTPGTTYAVTIGAGGAGANMLTSGFANSTGAQQGGYTAFNWTYNLLNGLANGGLEFGSTDWFRHNNGTGSYNHVSPLTTPIGESTTSVYVGGPLTYTANGYANPKYLYMDNLYPQGVSTNYSEYYTWVIIDPSTVYTLSSQWMNNVSSGNCNVVSYITWYTSKNGTYISSNNSGATTVTSQTSWTQRSVTATSPSNATYALIRLIAANPTTYGGGARVTAIQLEKGSSVTSYKNYTTAGSTLVSGLGVLTTTTGLIANGGGGGDSDWNIGQTLVGAGWGGGGRAYQSSSSNGSCSGNGWGAGTVPGKTIPIQSSSSTFMSVVQKFEPQSFSPLGSLRGSYGLAYTTAAYLIQGDGGQATPEGFGAGGMGSTALGDVARGTSGFGAGPAQFSDSIGVSGVANTGAGGCGGGANAGSSNAKNGGAGGSGALILSWVGE